MNTTAREIEAELLGRCVAVARTTSMKALDQREANIFYVAAIVIQSKFPSESLSSGMAVHLYTAGRVTTDVDAELGGRIAIPNDLLVNITLENDKQEFVYVADSVA
jgi:hypothetical protein